MNKLFLLLLLAIASTCCFSQKATTISSVHLRMEANTASQSKAVLPKNSVVTIQDSTEGWYLVNYNGRVGFVNSGYLIQTNEKGTDNYQQSSRQIRHPTSNTQIRYYTNADGNRIQSPTKYDAVPEGATAVCRDGTYSFSRNRRGTCSHHGGVAKWLQ